MELNEERFHFLAKFRRYSQTVLSDDADFIRDGLEEHRHCERLKKCDCLLTRLQSLRRGTPD